MEVILEGSKLKTVEAFHKEISGQLAFPDYYGKNLDALWDCITGYVEPPVHIIWKDFELVNGSFLANAPLICAFIGGGMIVLGVYFLIRKWFRRTA